MPDRLIKTLDGKRGSFLLFGGGAYLFIGLSYALATTPGRAAAFSWLPRPLESQMLGWVWVVGGALVGVVVLAGYVVVLRRAVEPSPAQVLVEPGFLLLTALVNGLTLLGVSQFYQPLSVGIVVVAAAFLTRFQK